MNKDVYRNLCKSEQSIPLFLQSWWLDAVAGDTWDVILVKKGKETVGALPYVTRKRWGFTTLTQPKLTQALGPWLRPTQKSYPKRLAHEKEVLGALADQLPCFDRYTQNWHFQRSNWLPFYWRGFEQTTLYTYRISLDEGDHALWNQLQENTRREIRKARGRFGIEVRSGSLDEFLSLNSLTFERQGQAVPYSRDLVSRIDQAASSRDARDCLVAVDQEGRLHAGAYILRSGDTAYYLMGGGDPSLRNSGAMSLVLWEAICQQPDDIQFFDFEGSMIEGIERFFRAFGAIQTPYFRVSKTRSKALKLMATIRSLRS